MDWRDPAWLDEASSWIREQVDGGLIGPFERSSQAFRASPSTPIVSAWRIQRSGVAIER